MKTCKCGATYREKWFDRFGNERIYTQCMACAKKEWEEKHKK